MFLLHQRCLSLSEKQGQTLTFTEDLVRAMLFYKNWSQALEKKKIYIKSSVAKKCNIMTSLTFWFGIWTWINNWEYILFPFSSVPPDLGIE